MKISIERLIGIVIREVIHELLRQGVKIDFDIQNKGYGSSKDHKIEIDMSDYKTPVLTEKQLLSIGKEIKEIIIPEGTVITPVADEMIKKQKLIIQRIKKSEVKCRG